MIFIDANIFMYAAGKDSPQKKPCAQFLRKVITSGKANQYFTNSEVLQEILHRYRSLKLSEKAFELYRWFLPLLRLDTVPKFVQLIKLVQQELEMGNERVRLPRMELTGVEREEALRLIRGALATRPGR
ncbi:MAG: PIN domain-containing protein [Blastocatellia bacterium]